MGFRFRRTFKIIPGVRLNLSRSGPSVSLGPRGLHYTLGLKGSRVTAGIPGSGLFWTKYQSYSPGPRSEQAPVQSLVPNDKLRDATVEPLPEKTNAELFESSPIEDLVAGSTSELTPLLNSARNRLRIQMIVLPLIALSFVFAIANNSPPAIAAVALLGLIVWSAAALFDQHRLTVKLEYNLQDDQSRPFNEMVKTFQQLMNCKRIWRIPVQTGQTDPKRNAGASFTDEREPLSLSTGTPTLIKSNVAFLCLPLGNKTLYFAPDAILVISGRSVAALRYDDLAVSVTPTKFIEDERPPDDAQVIGEAWQYVNKDGTPDRRFVNNRKLPICIYGELDLKSSRGINERIHCSSLEAAKKFAACVVTMCQTEPQPLDKHSTPNISPIASNGLENQTDQKANDASKVGGKTQQIGDTTTPPERSDIGDERISEVTKRLEMAEQTRALLNKTRSDLLSEMAESHEESIIKIKSTFEDGFKNLIVMLLCEIAGADGPIREKDAAIFNCVLEQPMDETAERWIAKYGSCNANYYNTVRASVPSDYFAVTLPSMFKFIAVVSAIANEARRTGIDEPDSSPIIGLVENLGQLVMALDDHISASKLKTFSKIISIVREQVEAAREFAATRMSSSPTKSDPLVSHQQQPDGGNTRKETLDQLVQELLSLIGLSSVKEEVETLINLAKVFAMRKEKGLPIPEISFHLVFSGNPGTGKTTVARIISKIYGDLKLLSKGHLVEVDRSGLVGNYVGQTATKVMSVIEQAKGGILFIDEAYALSEGSGNDFGHEAIETLLKAMEDYREDLVVIVAGYVDKMESFLGSNPGLRSRFPHVILFPDYSGEEMMAIFERLAQTDQYRLGDGVKEMITKEMQRRWQERGKDFANARDVRNVFERIIAMQANRIGTSGITSDDALTTISEADVRLALP